MDHAAEPLESMFVSLDDVTIGAKDFGKAEDNYELIQGADKAWGTDYNERGRRRALPPAHPDGYDLRADQRACSSSTPT